MRRNGLFWGVVLIVIGLVLLLDNLRILPFPIWGVVWPLVLIAFGAWMLWGVFVRRPAQSETAAIPLDGARQAELRLRHGAGRLELGAGADAGELLAGTFEGGLERRVSRVGEALQVEMQVPAQVWGPWDWAGRGMDWSIKVNRDVGLKLDIDTGASESRLDLRDLQVTELRIKTGASATEVDLPARAGFTRVSVSAGAASVTLRVPEGVAARVNASAGAGSVDIDGSRFPRGESPDYSTAPNRVEIEGHIGAGSLAIR